jgi:uncharacterized membrane protein
MNIPTSVIVGGLLPAVLFGLSGICQKLCGKEGIGVGPFLLGVGMTVIAVGGGFAWFEKDLSFNARSAGYTCLFGICWALGIGLIAVAIRHYEGQISQLVPLYNMNTLVAVAMGLVLLGEWQNLHVGRLAIAAVLITVGGILAATA